MSGRRNSYDIEYKLEQVRKIKAGSAVRAVARETRVAAKRLREWRDNEAKLIDVPNRRQRRRVRI